MHRNQEVLVNTIERTKALRASYQPVNVPASIFSSDKHQSLPSYRTSMAGDSSVEFDFDDVIVNSKAYRQAIKVKSAQTNIRPAQANVRPARANVFPARANPRPGANLRPKYLESIGEDWVDPLRFKTDGWIDPLGFSNTREVKIKKTTRGRDSFSKQYLIGPRLRNHKPSRYELRSATNRQSGAEVTGQLLYTDGEWHDRYWRSLCYIAAKLDHVNVPRQILFLGSDTQRSRIVYECSSQGSLYSAIKMYGRLQEAQARPLFRQILRAVAYLHRRGVIHGYIWTGSFLVNKSFDVISLINLWKASCFNPADTLSSNKELRLISEVYKLTPFLADFSGDLLPQYQSQEGMRDRRAPGIVFTEDKIAVYAGKKADLWNCGHVLVSLRPGLFRREITSRYPITLNPTPFLISIILITLVIWIDGYLPFISPLDSQFAF